MLNSCTVVWVFAILRESLNIWLYYVTFCMWLNGYFTFSAAAVLIRHPGRPSVVIRHAQWHWAQACKPLGWSVCPLNAPHHRCCPELMPGARKTSITSPSAIFSILGSCCPSRDRGICHHRPRVHHSLTPLHGLQINCATLKWLPSARHTQTWPWARALFSRQKLLEILISVIW